MKRKLMKIVKNILIFIVISSIMVLGYYSIELYFDYINSEVDKIEQSKKTEYTYKGETLNNEGLYTLNLSEELTDFLSEQDTDYLILKIEDEDFYLELSIKETENNEYSFNLEKIVNESKNVNARVNKNDIESIEYRTGNINDATVLKLNNLDYKDYFVMTEDTYYFLGEDIESISFMDNRFFYLSYNPKYYTLKEATECTKELKNDIEGYNKHDYFYRYGRINFLSDYYQKLASKSFSVDEWCKELKEKMVENN